MTLALLAYPDSEPKRRRFEAKLNELTSASLELPDPVESSPILDGPEFDQTGTSLGALAMPAARVTDSAITTAAGENVGSAETIFECRNARRMRGNPARDRCQRHAAEERAPPLAQRS